MVLLTPVPVLLLIRVRLTMHGIRQVALALAPIPSSLLTTLLCKHWSRPALAPLVPLVSVMDGGQVARRICLLSMALLLGLLALLMVKVVAVLKELSSLVASPEIF